MFTTKELEFTILMARLCGDTKISAIDYDVTLDGDNVEVNLRVRPFNIEFVTLEVTNKGIDRFSGRFRPFSLIQEELETNELEDFDGTPAEKYMLAFLFVNLDYADRLDEGLRGKLLSIIQKGNFK